MAERCPYIGETSQPSPLRALSATPARRAFVIGHEGATRPGAGAPFGGEQV